jgi:hypothetical protein
VPAIEEGWIDLDATPVLLDRALELADREVAIRVVENIFESFHPLDGCRATR